MYNIKNVDLHTKDLKIREPRQTDIQDWHALLSDADNMYFLQDIVTKTFEDSQRNLAEAIKSSRQIKPLPKDIPLCNGFAYYDFSISTHTSLQRLPS